MTQLSIVTFSEFQYLTLALFPSIVVALGCIVYLFRGSSFGKGNLDFRGRLARHILVDTLMLFVASFFYFGYPDVPLGTVVRLIGIFTQTRTYVSQHEIENLIEIEYFNVVFFRR